MSEEYKDEHAFVHENLAAYLAGGLEAAERGRFDAHVNGCAACFDAFTEARDADRAMQRALAGLMPEGGAGDFEKRLVKGFREQTMTTRQLFVRKAGYAAAAAVALAATGVFANYAIRQTGLNNPVTERLIGKAELANPMTRLGWLFSRKDSGSQNGSISDATNSQPFIFNYQEAPVATVVDDVGKRFGLTVAMPPGMSGKITATSRKPSNESESMSLLEDVLYPLGYATKIAPIEGTDQRLLQVVSIAEAKKSQIPVYTGSDPNKIDVSDRLITQIIPLQHADAANVRSNVGSLLSADADIAVNKGTNAIVVTDTSARVRKLAEAIEKIDAPQVAFGDAHVGSFARSQAAGGGGGFGGGGAVPVPGAVAAGTAGSDKGLGLVTGKPAEVEELRAAPASGRGGRGGRGGGGGAGGGGGGGGFGGGGGAGGNGRGISGANTYAYNDSINSTGAVAAQQRSGLASTGAVAGRSLDMLSDVKDGPASSVNQRLDKGLPALQASSGMQAGSSFMRTNVAPELAYKADTSLGTLGEVNAGAPVRALRAGEAGNGPVAAAEPAAVAPAAADNRAYYKTTNFGLDVPQQQIAQLGNDATHNLSDVRMQFTNGTVLQSGTRTGYTMAPAGATATQPGAAEGAGATTSVEAPEVASRKIIRNGTVEFEVRSFDDTADTVAKITTEEKGFVSSTSSDKLANGKVRGTIVVRIPPENLDRFLLKIRALGELKTQQIGSSDVTKEYTDIESELRGLRTMEGRLLDLIKTGKGEVKELVEAEKQLGEYRIRIEKLEGEIRYYNNLVGMATLTITAYEKDIQKPTAAAEQENIAIAVQTEEVETKYAVARKIIEDAKGRIVESQLKNTDAEHVAASISADVAPDKTDFVAVQLKQLGVVANFVRDRRQTTTGGPGAPPPGVQVEQKDTRFVISLFNLANLAPRETVVMNVAVRDVEGSYRKILGMLRAGGDAAGTQPARSGQRVMSSNLNGQQPDQMTADIVAEVKTDAGGGGGGDAIVQAIRDSGEVLTSTIAENQDKANSTAAKRGIQVRFINVAAVPARESQSLRIVAADVPAAYGKLLASLQTLAGAGNARIVSSSLNQSDPRTVTGAMTFEVRRDSLAALEKAFGEAGVDFLVRNITRSTNTAGTLDSKVLFQVDSLQSADSLDPRRSITQTVEVDNVDKAVEALRAYATGATAKEMDFNTAKEPNGRVTAHLTLDAPTADTGALLTHIRDLGGVERDNQVSRNANVPETRFAKDRVMLTLTSRAAIVDANQGLWPTVRAALSSAAAALLYSVYLVVTGLLFVLPFALIVWPLWRMARRRKVSA